MIRFSLRDGFWLTALIGLSVAWYLDRSNLVVPAADYRRLKAVEATRVQTDIEIMKAMKTWQESRATLPVSESLNRELPSESSAKTKLRAVPGDLDYQFPPNYPLYYKKSPVESQGRLGPDEE